MSVRTKLTLFDAALLRTGNRASSAGSGTLIWQALEANYPEIVRQAFEDQKYNFGKARTELTSRSAGRFGYDDAFTYPAEVIHITDVFINDYRASVLQASWEIDAATRELFIDANNRTIEIEYIKEGLEYTWSAHFAQGVQRRLEAVIKEVEEEDGEAEAREAKADLMFLKGGVNDSKGRSRERFRRGGRLVRAHRGYRRD
jgi:hypothetical protein